MIILLMNKENKSIKYIIMDRIWNCIIRTSPIVSYDRIF